MNSIIIQVLTQEYNALNTIVTLTYVYELPIYLFTLVQKSTMNKIREVGAKLCIADP